MRALIINPKEKTITEREVSGSFKENYRIMECDIIEPYRGIPGHVVWVDEEGLWKTNQYSFKIVTQDLVGTAIILGGKEGNKPCKISLEEAKKLITFSL